MTHILSWLVAILVPLALIGLGLRAVLLPLFPQVEYRMPYFPPDDYGFTMQDRLRWTGYAWDYLLNDADISYLGDLQFDDGTSLYNERELSHMADVKRVITGSFRVWYMSLVLLVTLGAWAWFGSWWQDYRLGLSRGGWLMVWLAAAIGLIVVVGLVINPNIFWNFFAGFHHLFFTGDSWLFEFSDTLIRLFPLRFWMDAFLFAAIIALGGGVALGLIFKR